MPRKPVIAKETAAPAKPVKAVTPAVPARAAKPRTPRVKTAQHSKIVPAEPAVVMASPENPQEAIAKIAYSYWESRGYQGGAALEDWVRAEREYRQRAAK